MQNGLENHPPLDRTSPIPPSPPQLSHDGGASTNDISGIDLDVKDASVVKAEESVVGASEEDGGPPAKRRRLGDSSLLQRPSSRAASPPWKKVAADGPTSFMDEGKRRSARTNTLPLELRPQSGKRQTRAAISRNDASVKSKYSGSKSFNSSPLAPAKATPQQYGKRSKLGTRASMPSVRSAAKAQATATTPATPTRRAALRQSSRRKPSPSPPSSPNTIKKRGPGRPRKNTAESITAKSYQRRGKRDPSVKDEAVEDVESDDDDLDVDSLDETDDDFTVDPNITPQRLNLKVRVPEVKPQHPLQIPLPKKHASFRQWVDSGTWDDGPSVHMTETQVKGEARARLQVLDALGPNGALSNVSENDVPEPADEPVAYYHHNYLLGHAVNMRGLMDKEKRRHKVWAQKICAAIHEYWATSKPKTKEELKEEEEAQWKTYYQAIMRQCSLDLVDKYGMLRVELENHRFKLWQQEEEIRNRAAMMNVAEEKRKRVELRVRRDSSVGGDESTDEEDESGLDGADTEDPASESDESNMSIDSEEREQDSEGDLDADQDLSPEELRKKYETSALDSAVEVEEKAIAASVGEISRPSTPALNETDESGAVHTTAETEEKPAPRAQAEESYMELDEAQLDETDESTDMDDDMGDSDEGSDDEDTEGSSEDSDAEPDATYLSLFSADELEKAKAQAAAAKPEDDAVDKDSAADPEVKSQIHNGNTASSEDDKKQAIPRELVDETQKSIEQSTHSPSLLAVTQVQTPPASNSEAPSISMGNDREKSQSEAPAATDTSGSNELETEQAKPEEDAPEDLATSLPATPVSSARIKTPVPSLLRGTLREYQHQGLDWLVGLYENEDNGILADEMGLGKTVQTIALLAHLAEKYGQWGPHLIVVPTSVMLNWEMEFKKFLPGFKVLTYYGSQEERKQKRKGWLDDNKWNAVITSYQLVLKDEVSFKKRGWHYLVLDEAHNIKNFKSQRWQTLLTFKTAARLLLTGTPLQNNLAELWSLMFFLMPSEENETGVQGFTDLEKFTAWFKKPVDQIMEQGRGTMDKEAQELVRTLHQILRPYLLRRLKADVEKQMPEKHEHVVYCKLSKRQRYLYDGFMSRADTRQQLASGNYLSIINCLMQLRKVCNHPDLFEERPIVTSFALKKPVIADYEIKELLVRRRLLKEEDERRVSLDFVDLLPGSNGPVSALATLQQSRIVGIKRIRDLAFQLGDRVQTNMRFEGSSAEDALAFCRNQQKDDTRESLHHLAYITSLRSQRRPLMSHSLIDKLKLDLKPAALRERPVRRTQLSRWLVGQSPAMEDMVLNLPRRFESLQNTVQRFSFVTPSVTLKQDHISELYLTASGKSVVQTARRSFPQDSFHESRMRLSIAFPDKRLLQYDCGKLQRLDALLRTLQSGNHRALIFTQMTKVLDVLERFLNIHGHRYLRLDGSTKVEQRQILTERFNNDPKIPVFILSSRSGGLGINLTGADTVIFYDLDWNPAMDKQCQDRCHRIGQTRDVHIYRFVSEYTIEANILRKANQKRLLDDVIIQEGEFTTDTFNKANAREALGDEAMHEQDTEASAAMDRILGAGTSTAASDNRMLAQADEEEDRKAALIAEKEAQYTEDPKEFEDPEDPGSSSSKQAASSAAASAGGRDRAASAALTAGGRAGSAAADDAPHADDSPEVVRGVRQPRSELELDVFAAREPVGIDLYMLRLLQWEVRDVPLGPPPGLERSKRPAHRLGRKR